MTFKLAHALKDSLMLQGESLCGGNTTYCHLLPCNEDLPCTPEGGCGDTVNSCDSNPCPWNATCQVSVLTQTYECQCPAGYEGTHCEIPMKRCYRNICKYGGECYVGEGGPTCFCTMGYKGTLCETPEDECLWNPCKNGAVCRNRGKGYACYCVPGFQGPLCDIEVDECASQPCQNGATCLNQIGSYTCVCHPKYTGRDCELEFNECSSGPCLNGGSCHNSQSSFSCSCPSGFSGDLCEHNVDECNSSPCLNGGQCLDKNNGYTCNCSMVGFIGLHCETPLPQNTATCLEGSGNITCLCGPGVHCEEDINECETNPCQNGGTCENTNGSYICHCAANKDMTGQYYGGRDCQELLIGCEGSTCHNGGSCNPYLIDGKHLYSCLCPAGFTDPDCRTQTTFSFNGKTVLPLGNLIFQNKDSPISNISLSFQTVQISALIFHLGDNTTFLRLFIQDGDMFLFSYVNGHQKTFLHLSHNISDDRWHAVEVIFTDIITLRLLDTACTIRCAQSVANNITSHLTSFTLDNLFFGGDTPAAPGVYSYFSNTVLHQAGFVGCMRDIRVDSRTVTAEGPMLDSIEVGCKRQDHCEYSPCQNRGQCVNLWLGYHCDCYRPYRGNNCSSEYESGRFGHGDMASYAIFHLGNKQTDDIDLSAFVRTLQPSGLLFALGNATSYGIVVSLQGGKLVVRNSNDIVLKCEHIINDGQFHLISLKVTQNTMECLVSSRSLVRISIAATRVNALSVLYVGGLEDATETLKREGYFKGCIQDLRIGSRKLEFFPDSQSYIVNQILHNVTQGCSSDNLCKSNPCQNGGACYPVWDDFTCTCPPNTTGKACEELKWCEIIQCPPKAVCQPVPNGFECITSVVFRGTGHGIRYMSNGNISRDLTNLTLGFRTGCSESVLLHAEREPETIMLAVRDSRLVLNLQSGNSLYAVTLAGKEKVSDSQWHNVTISMTSPGSQSSRWQMEIDGKTDEISNVATGNLNFLKERIDIYLGAHNQGKLQDFTGCLGTVVIGGLHLPYFGENDYQLKKPQIEQFVKTSPGSVSIGCLSLNPCASHPCLNGGNCQDFLTHPVCTCPAGRTGKFCEMEIDECLSNPCLHGNCTDGAGGYTCECQTGYTGTNCDINICHGHMCPSGTTCVEGPLGFFCLCPANVTGPYCSLFSPSEASPLSLVRIYNRLPSTFCGNEKKNITCYNFSNCTEENGALRCICLAGFVGQRCEVDIDECESDPCMNGGLCQNLPNRFLCICDVNYAGEQCEIDQSNSLQPGVFTIVASVVLALFFATCAGICIFIAVASMRSSQGTYSPSRQEKEGSRVEMWNIVQPPPLERLI
ncbi:protein crumbs homolog 1 [Spea bombifrons]|uniref:protein crumbs homolog 1 n=1 Tax=Spea bombifrons TaxID=233779 RepID=UPI00234BEC73|nr:protein crumbs homolog 1 [Spea bombifrons]